MTETDFNVDAFKKYLQSLSESTLDMLNTNLEEDKQKTYTEMAPLEKKYDLAKKVLEKELETDGNIRLMDTKLSSLQKEYDELKDTITKNKQGQIKKKTDELEKRKQKLLEELSEIENDIKNVDELVNRSQLNYIRRLTKIEHEMADTRTKKENATKRKPSREFLKLQMQYEPLKKKYDELVLKEILRREEVMRRKVAFRQSLYAPKPEPVTEPDFEPDIQVMPCCRYYIMGQHYGNCHQHPDYCPICKGTYHDSPDCPRTEKHAAKPIVKSIQEQESEVEQLRVAEGKRMETEKKVAVKKPLIRNVLKKEYVQPRYESEEDDDESVSEEESEEEQEDSESESDEYTDSE